MPLCNAPFSAEGIPRVSRCLVHGYEARGLGCPVFLLASQVVSWILCERWHLVHVLQLQIPIKAVAGTDSLIDLRDRAGGKLQSAIHPAVPRLTRLNIRIQEAVSGHRIARSQARFRINAT